MAARIIDDSKLNDIAVAIQAKDSGGRMTVDDMPDRIDALPTGGTLIPKTITENGVYNATDDNADGYDVVTVDVPERNTLKELCLNTLEIADITNVTIVTPYLFHYKSNLVNVIMPDVIEFKDSAFEGCSNLMLTSLPSGVITIGYRAFPDCPKLMLTSLPSGVTSIGDSAFRRCTELALTSLPSGVTSIGESAFNGCTKLALTSLPNGVTKIESRTFEGCSNLMLTSLPSGVTSIGNYAFRYCSNIPYLDFSDFTGIPTVVTNSFSGTTFPFYFRDQQQLDEWAAATNWSTYADRFQIKPSGVI